jgi:hypothetical protein
VEAEVLMSVVGPAYIARQLVLNDGRKRDYQPAQGQHGRSDAQWQLNRSLVGVFGGCPMSLIAT